MFTPRDRELLVEELLQWSMSIEGVGGFLVVGSGATGFRDRFSDVDVLFVVQESDQVPSVNQKVIRYMSSKYELIKHKIYQHEPDIYVTCFFLSIYLNVDVGIWAFHKLRATKPNWLIKFDKVGGIEEKLKQSLEEEQHPMPEDVIGQSLDTFWQYVYGAAVSINRNQGIKAVKDMEMIRNEIIRFISIFNEVRYDYDKTIDSLNKDDLVMRLQQSYEVKMNKGNLGQTLLTLVSLYFEAIRRSYWNNEVEEYKQIIVEYIDQMLAIEERIADN